MKRMHAVLRSIFVATLMLGFSQAQAGLIGVSFGGGLYSIDQTNGATTFIGSTGFSALNALAADSGGTIYSTSGSNLLSINTTTGAGTSVATISGLGEGTSIRGLAFSSSNVLYAINNGGSPGSTSVDDKLYTINTTTGAATLLGSVTGFKGVQGLDFNSSDSLFAWDISKGLLSLNSSTAAGVDVNTSVGGGDPQSIAFAADDSLFGVRNQLNSINVTTGALTFLGNTGLDIRGIEFIADVPEPATLTLLLLGLMGMRFNRRKLSVS